MAVRHPAALHKALLPSLPVLWLVTDERMGEQLWPALAALPKGSGVLFRHFATDRRARAEMFDRVARIARRRRLLLVESGAERQPVRIRPAHSIREAVAARRDRADLMLVSPIYPTRTHPGARALGPLRAAVIARATHIPAIAMGGVTRARFRHLRGLGFVGWAAIDGLTPSGDQKRKAVPI